MSPTPSSTVVWTIRALAVLAGGLAGYLWYITAVAKGLPLGCGADSGCADVLTSRWSSVIGVSVAALAVALDAVIVAATLGLASSSSRTRLVSSAVLVAGAWTLLGAAIYFVGIQAAVVRAFCPWCLADHLVAMLLAAVILVSLAAPVAAHVGVWPPAIVGMAGLAVVMGLQATIDPPQLELHRLDGESTSAGSLVTLFDGKMAVDRNDVPKLGAADAPHALALMYDYCCPHCRATHGYLAEALQRYPGQIVVMALPTPMNTECNPYHDETEPRFKNSCELARFALAVWNADPAKFAEYDAWLFEPETPREVAEAQSQAERLVGQDAFADALADPWVEAQLKRNVQGYHDGHAERVPVIVGPGLTAIVGRPDDAAMLFDELERAWKLAPTAP